MNDEECPFCKTRKVLKSIMQRIELEIPMTGAELFDDEITNVYNACGDALSMFKLDECPTAQIEECRAAAPEAAE